jgi:uncharacterized metal-binding protein
LYKSTSSLTNNFRANVAILAISILVASIFAILFPEAYVKLVGWNQRGIGGFIRHATVFVGAYLLGSFWLSPDLDVYTNRPGKYSFPGGPIFKIFYSGSASQLRVRRSLRPLRWVLDPLKLILLPPHIILNLCWNIYWQPFAALFTHRGAVHWPLLGTNLKIVYLYLTYFTVAKICYLSGVAALPLVSFGVWDGLFGKGGVYHSIAGSSYATTAILAWAISDVCHSAVDLWDSLKEGKKFVPPAMIAPRGFFIQFWAFLKHALSQKKRRL